MNWVSFATKVPMVIAGVVKIIGKVKGASKADKVDAAIEAIMDSVALSEFVIEKDALNDANIKTLLATVVKIEHDLEEARAALKAGLLNKK